MHNIHLFTKPQTTVKTRYKKGDRVWIIEDEIQDNGRYIDKIKLAKITKVESEWIPDYLFSIKLSGKTIKIITYYWQLNWYTVETGTMKRITNSTNGFFSSLAKVQKFFSKYYDSEEYDL